MNLASEFVSKKGKEILSLKSEFESDLVLVIDQAEVVYLGMLSHPHLVKLVGFCNQDDHRMLVYEYMPRGSLENHLFKSKHYTLLLLHEQIAETCLAFSESLIEK